MAENGRVVQVMGPVVDVEFPRGSVPKVYDALHVENGLTLEVQQQIGDGVVRTIAMGSSRAITKEATDGSPSARSQT